LKRNELPGQTNAANGRTRSTRASRRSGTLPAFVDRDFQQLLKCRPGADPGGDYRRLIVCPKQNRRLDTKERELKDPHLRPFASIRASDLHARTPIRRYADTPIRCGRAGAFAASPH
jgi:hypothetical protein